VTAAPSPSVAPLRKEFGDAIERHLVSCGDTIVYASRERVHDVLEWLKETPGQDYSYLTDITAVDYRDPELPLEVVWQIRALDRPADMRERLKQGKRGFVE
jgi:NADH:ubiquinone oxidoreductase subunit C